MNCKRCDGERRCDLDGHLPAVLPQVDPLRGVNITVVRCLTCWQMLPLGEASDTINVNIEIRSAEIAARWFITSDVDADFYPTQLSDEELRGWSLAETNMQHHTDAWHAGYLARTITQHDSGTEQEEG